MSSASLGLSALELVKDATILDCVDADATSYFAREHGAIGTYILKMETNATVSCAWK